MDDTTPTPTQEETPVVEDTPTPEETPDPEEETVEVAPVDYHNQFGAPVRDSYLIQ